MPIASVNNAIAVKPAALAQLDAARNARPGRSSLQISARSHLSLPLLAIRRTLPRGTSPFSKRRSPLRRACSEVIPSSSFRSARTHLHVENESSHIAHMLLPRRFSRSSSKPCLVLVGTDAPPPNPPRQYARTSQAENAPTPPLTAPAPPSRARHSSNFSVGAAKLRPPTLSLSAWNQSPLLLHPIQRPCTRTLPRYSTHPRSCSIHRAMRISGGRGPHRCVLDHQRVERGRANDRTVDRTSLPP